jgi:hypothetical protein
LFAPVDSCPVVIVAVPEIVNGAVMAAPLLLFNVKLLKSERLAGRVMPDPVPETVSDEVVPPRRLVGVPASAL